MSAALRDPNRSDEEPLRPTRAADASRSIPVRETREPIAPFVAAPPSPRIARAPRVVARPLESMTAAVRAEPAPDRPPTQAQSEPRPVATNQVVIASFRVDRAAAALAALRARGMSVTPLVPSAPGAQGLAGELARALRRATMVATVLGVLGALIGALIVPSEALIPSLGWLPGPAAGAALFAGALGALGFVLGLLALLVLPARALAPLTAGDRALVAIAAPLADAAVAVVPLGGEIIARS